jgi:hypothetical protein
MAGSFVIFVSVSPSGPRNFCCKSLVIDFPVIFSTTLPRMMKLVCA